MKKLKKIIDILFKYPTENYNGRSNRNISLCLNELSAFLRTKKIHNKVQYYSVKGNSIKHANLVAFNPEISGPYILFQGHVDTIPDISAFKPVITSSKINGRGAVDMKGPLAGLIDAFIALYKKYPVMLLVTGDEEANSFAGIEHFLKNNKKLVESIYLAINAEPSDFKIYRRFKGVIGYRLRASARGGHSAYPRRQSLIEKMMPIINKVNEFLDKAKGIEDERFGRTIAAFTVLRAGIKNNQLPEDFEMKFNLRTVKGYKIYEKLFQEIVSIPASSIKINKFHFNPSSAKITNRCLKALRNAFVKTGIGYKEAVARYFTEATCMNNAKITTIICGPGNPRLAHINSREEMIDMKDIVTYSDLLQNIVRNLNEQT